MLRNHEHLAALNTGINRMHQSIRILAVFIVCKQGQETQIILIFVSLVVEETANYILQIAS